MTFTRYADDEMLARAYQAGWVRARRPRIPRPPVPGGARRMQGGFVVDRQGNLHWPQGTPGRLGGRFAEKGAKLIGQVVQAFGATRTPIERAQILSLLDDKQVAAVAKASGVKLPKGVDRMGALRQIALGYDRALVPARSAPEIPAGTRAADALELVPDDPQDAKAGPKQRWEALRGLSPEDLRDVAEQVGVRVPLHPLRALREEYGDWDSDPEVLARMPAAGLERLAMHMGLRYDADPARGLSKRQVRELRARLVEAVKDRPGVGVDAEFDQNALATFVAQRYKRPPKPRAPRKPPPTPDERREALDALREKYGDWSQDASVLDGMKRAELRLVAAELGVPQRSEKVPALRARLVRAVEHHRKTGFKPGEWEQVDPAALRQEALAKVDAALARRGDPKSREYKLARAQLMRLVDELYPETPTTDDLVLRNGGYTVTVRGGTRDVDTTGLVGRLERLIVDHPEAGPVSAVVIADRRMHKVEGEGVLGYVLPAASEADIHAMVLSDGLWAQTRDRSPHGHFMRQSKKHSRSDYVIAHEFGHLLEPDDPGDVPESGMSEYGQTNEHEAFAEAFAEWHLSGGRTRSSAARTYAERYGWPGTAPEPEPAVEPRPATKTAPASARRVVAAVPVPRLTGVAARRRAERDEFVRDEFEQWREAHPEVTGTDAEVQSRIVAEMREQLDDAEIVVRRRSESSLRDILSGGRMKTVHETGTSGVGQDAESRRRYEELEWGYGGDSDPAERPVYGYARPAGADRDPELAETYGGIRIVLKPEVRGRTSFSLGDSMDKESVTSPLDNPDWRSFDFSTEFGRTVPLGQDYSSAEFTDLVGYVETQIHGGVRVEDIAEVTFDQEPERATIDALERAGVSWRMTPTGPLLIGRQRRPDDDIASENYYGLGSRVIAALDGWDGKGRDPLRELSRDQLRAAVGQLELWRVDRDKASARQLRDAIREYHASIKDKPRAEDAPGPEEAAKRKVDRPAPRLRGVARGPEPRASLADAQSVAELNDAAQAEAKRITGRDITFDFGESDVDVSREHAEGILRGLEAFPDAKLTAVRMADMLADFRRRHDGDDGEVWAYARQLDDGTYEIAFSQSSSSTEGVRDYRESLERTGQVRRMGRGHVGGTPMSVALHEFGHVVDHTEGFGVLGRIASRMADEHLEAIGYHHGAAGTSLERSSADAKRRIAFGFIVSRYAMENDRELAAEIFADVMEHGDDASELSRAIFDAFEDELEARR